MRVIPKQWNRWWYIVPFMVSVAYGRDQLRCGMKLSFCTYAEQDDVREPALTPWVGFVYTFPGYRGKRYMGIASRLVEHALSALKAEGINKVALLVFNYNETGNAFWGAACQWHAFSTDRAGRRDDQGFTARNDVTYRNKVLTEMVRIDT